MGTTPNPIPTYYVVFGNRETEWVLGAYTEIEKAWAFFDSLNLTQSGEWRSIRTRFPRIPGDNPWAA